MGFGFGHVEFTHKTAIWKAIRNVENMCESWSCYDILQVLSEQKFGSQEK